MARWILGLVAVLGLAAQSACAQVYYYGAPQAVYVPGSVYAPRVAVAAPVVTSAYFQPLYTAPQYVAQQAYVAPQVYVAPRAYVAPSPVVQMAYTEQVIVPRGVVTAPLPTGGMVRQTVRGGPYNYTQTTKTWGDGTGAHYNRVRVHTGLFGATTVRERNW
jgi:hypothetical protein